MKVYRIAFALILLLPPAWDGMADTVNPQQTTISRIVFLVH